MTINGRSALVLVALFLTSLAVSADSWELRSQAVFSPLMGTGYSIQIAAPQGIDSDHDIPLVVVLDGNWYFDGTHWRLGDDGVLGICERLHEAGQIPDVIFVGVGFVDSQQRSKAFLLQYRHFYRFLTDELLPFLEEDLPVDAEHRILIGHSDAGMFAFYAFTQSILGEGVFTDFVALSPDFSKLAEAAYAWEGSARQALDADRATLRPYTSGQARVRRTASSSATCEWRRSLKSGPTLCFGSRQSSPRGQTT